MSSGDSSERFAEVVDGVDGGKGIVDAWRDGAESDFDEFLHDEFEVLGGGALAADVDIVSDASADLVGELLRGQDADDWFVAGDEVTWSQEESELEVVFDGGVDEAFEVDGLDVSGVGGVAGGGVIPGVGVVCEAVGVGRAVGWVGVVGCGGFWLVEVVGQGAVDDGVEFGGDDHEYVRGLD